MKTTAVGRGRFGVLVGALSLAVSSLIGVGTAAADPTRVRLDPNDPYPYLDPNSSTCFRIPAPAKPGDLAVLNVITVDANSDGYTSARPYGSVPTYDLTNAPVSSTGNFLGDPNYINPGPNTRSVDPNMTIVRIGAVDGSATDGGVCVDLRTEQKISDLGTGNLVVDYIGYMPAGGGARADLGPVKLFV